MGVARARYLPGALEEELLVDMRERWLHGALREDARNEVLRAHLHTPGLGPQGAGGNSGVKGPANTGR